MMLYEVMQALIHSPDGDPDLFDIVAGIWRLDTLVSFYL